jgi:hypothetical protein
MHDTGRSKSAPSGRNRLLFSAYLDLGVALKYDIKLVLPCVYVGRIFLAGLKTIKTCKQSLAACDVSLRHLLQ